MSFFARGNQKPPASASRFNPDHPFMRAFALSVLFDGAGTFPMWRGNTGWNNGGGALFGGPTVHVGGDVKPRAASIADPFDAIGTSWITNTEGMGLVMRTAFNNIVLGESSGFPTAAITIGIIRKNLVASGVGGTGRDFQVGSTTSLIQTHSPYDGDSNTYWRFGGTAGANNVNGNTGLGSADTAPRRLIFSGGPRGLQVWQDGALVLSSSTAVTRAASTSDFVINGAGGGNEGHAQCEYNFLHIVGEQWSDELCRWWSAEPYDHLYSPITSRSYLFLGGGGGGAVESPYGGFFID